MEGNAQKYENVLQGKADPGVLYRSAFRFIPLLLSSSLLLIQGLASTVRDIVYLRPEEYAVAKFDVLGCGTLSHSDVRIGRQRSNLSFLLQSRR